MTIRVRLIKPDDRRFILCRWEDPLTGKLKTKSTKTTNRREAERFAGRLKDELNSGEFKPLVKATWEEVRTRYMNEVGRSHAVKTQQKAESMFNAMEELIGPKFVAAITPSVISQFQSLLRDGGRAEATIAGHLSVLRRVLRWAAKMDMIRKVPHIEFPTVVGRMKGRPITLEEFERFQMEIDKTDHVFHQYRPGWKAFAEGLWLSGLRLEEAMELHWTDDRRLCVDLSHRRPMLRIQAAAEKGRTFRLLPITPDFAEFLGKTPIENRRGFVFNPLVLSQGQKRLIGKKHSAHRSSAAHAGKVLCRIGESAKIKVSDSKFASAHDFRRAFGFRWAKLVMPKVLQELMRHASIQTTMSYYVGNLAEDAADEVYKAAARFGNTFGGTGSQESLPAPSEPEKSH